MIDVHPVYYKHKDDSLNRKLCRKKYKVLWLNKGMYYCNNGLWDRPDIFFYPYLCNIVSGVVPQLDTYHTYFNYMQNEDLFCVWLNLI